MDLILHIIGLAFIPVILITIYFSCEEVLRNIEEYLHYKEKTSQYLQNFISKLEKSHAELRVTTTDNSSLKTHY
jgi:DNA-binding transcriptional regulator YbjK